MSGKVTIEKNKTNKSQDQGAIRLNVTGNGKITVFELNGNAAAKDLYAQQIGRAHV